MLSLFDIKRLMHPEHENEIEDDFRIIDTWAEYDSESHVTPKKRSLEYLCYELEVKDPGTGKITRFYKAIKFARVIRLPAAAKQSTSLMDMHQEVMASIHENNYNFITVIANVIRPEPLGLLFLYGVQGVSQNLDEAKDTADKDFIGLVSMLQGTYRVLELQVAKAEETEWLREKIYNMPYLTMVRGIPYASKTGEDVGNKGMGNKNVNPDSEGTLEEIIEGMADYEYVIEVLSTPVYMDTLLGWQRRSQKDMTAWYNHLQGQTNLSFNLSIPMMYMASASQSQGWSKAYTDGSTVSTAQGESFTVSNGQSIGESLSQSYSQSHGHTEGRSLSNSHSVGVTDTTGTTIGQTYGQTYGQTLGHTQGHGTSAGMSVGQSANHSFSSNTGQNSGISQNLGKSTGQSFNEGFSTGESVTSTQGRSLTSTHGTSQGSSYSQNANTNVSQSHSVGNSHSLGQNQSNGWSQNHADTYNDGVTRGHTSTETNGTTLTDGRTETQGITRTQGVSDTRGTSDTHTTNSSYTEGGSKSGSAGFLGIGGTWSDSHSTTQGTSDAHTDSSSHTASESISRSASASNSHSNSVSNSVSSADSVSRSTSYGGSDSYGRSGSYGSNESWGTNESYSGSISNGFGESYGVNQSVSDSFSSGQSVSLSNGRTAGHNVSSGATIGNSYSLGQSYGVSSSKGESLGTGTSQSMNVGQSANISDSYSQSISQSASQSMSQSRSHSNSETVGETYGQSVSESTSESNGISTGQNQSRSTSTSNGNSYTLSNGLTKSTSNGKTGTTSLGTSASMGLGPSIGYSKSHQWMDQGVKDLLELMEFQNERIKKALRGEGAFYTYVYIACPSLDSLAAAQALAKSTWTNENAMIQPLQVLDLSDAEQQHLLYRFAAFSTDVTKEDVYGVKEYKYCTVLLPEEFVAYTHLPRVSEGGVFSTIQDIPKFSVPSMLQGEIYMGNILNAERFTFKNGYNTPFDYRIDEKTLMHGVFTGGSRSGKTVAATRFIAELSQIRRSKTGKRLRIVVLDPKQDWRVLSRFVEPSRFNFYSMGNVNFRSIRINPWKVPKGVWPQIWADGIIDIYCRAYGLLERGKQMIADVVYELYEDAGVFKACEKDNWKETVPKLSAKVNFVSIYKKFEEKKIAAENPANLRDKMGNDTRDAFARLLERLSVFGREFSIERKLYGSSEGIAIDELIGNDDITVLESKGLENTFKNFIFGAVTAGFYQFAIAHEGGYLSDDQYETVLVIEEANEILIGTDTAGKGGDSLSLPGESQFEQMLDQAAGYGLFIFAITQKIAAMPSSVVANCGIVFAGRQTRADDITVVTKLLGKDERYDDRDVAKWFPRCPTGWFICKTSRTFNFKDADPILVQIEKLNMAPPTNQELDEILVDKMVSAAIGA